MNCFKEIKSFVIKNKKNIICLCIFALSYYLFWLFEHISDSIFYNAVVNCSSIECNASKQKFIFDLLQYITLPTSLIMTIIFTRLLFIKNFNVYSKNNLAHKIYKISFIPYFLTFGFAFMLSIIGDSGGFISFSGPAVFLLCVILFIGWFLPFYIIILTYQILYIKNKKNFIKEK